MHQPVPWRGIGQGRAQHLSTTPSHNKGERTMAYQLFVALAPALASLLLCVCVEGPALARVMRAKWQSVLKHMREDEALLELLAELTVHLSTYGTAVVGFVAHAFAAAHFGGQAPVVLTVLG